MRRFLVSTAIGFVLALTAAFGLISAQAATPSVPASGAIGDFAPHTDFILAQQESYIASAVSSSAPAPQVSAPVVSTPAPVVSAPAVAAPVISAVPTTTTTTTTPAVPVQTYTVTNWVVYLTWSAPNQPDLTTTLEDDQATVEGFYSTYEGLIGTSSPSAPTGYTLSAVSAPTQVTNSVTTQGG